MSAQQLIDTLHRLEELSVIVVVENDTALMEAVSYELEGEDEQ